MGKNDKQLMWELFLIALVAAMFLIGCGDDVSREISNPVTIQPRPVSHDPDNENHLPSNAIVVEVTAQDMRAVAEQMEPGMSGSDPYYLLTDRATNGGDEYMVFLKRVD